MPASSNAKARPEGQEKKDEQEERTGAQGQRGVPQGHRPEDEKTIGDEHGPGQEEQS